MATRRISRTALLALVLAYGGCDGQLLPQPPDPDQEAQTLTARGSGPRPTIVLVHGAFVDGTSWQKVIPLLERDGYPVTAVQNTMVGLAEDIATTTRVIDAAAAIGPVVVVGHSYGGAVITAATVNPAVKALVYIDAFAPDAGELVGDLSHRFGPVPLDAAQVVDTAGFITIDRAKFRDLFCADVPVVDARVVAAVQKPTHFTVFGAPVPVAAWKQKPSWYLIGKEDNAISPKLQRFMAERIKAHTREIHSSHASVLSNPHAVTRLIEEADRATR